MKTYEIRCRENGDSITEFGTREEAEKVLTYYGHQDMLEEIGYVDKTREDEFERFYEIVEVEE